MKRAKRGKWIHGRLSVAILAFAACLSANPIASAQASASPNESHRTVELRLPPGTILPAKLEHGISSKKARSGETIVLRLMQDVPLPDGGKIRESSRIRGKVVEATPAAKNSGGRLVMRFDELDVRHERITISASLRAIASLSEVQEAEIPVASIGFGTSYNWATTRQIGGDVRYGLDGPVTDSHNNEVGRGEYIGALAHVRANSEGGCRGAMEDDRLQALWVFSSDACGVYGLDGTEIAHAGRDEPVGTIVLKMQRGDVNLRGGTGMLLRVIEVRPGTSQLRVNQQLSPAPI